MIFLAFCRSDDTRLKRQRNEPKESERVEVPRELKGRVIGKGGGVIKEIRRSSGALITCEKDDDWFTVSGDAEQRACARRLLLEKVVSFETITNKNNNYY